jgi:amino-acid N-acetyltransferase
VKVRNAKISDAKVICSLINYYAEHDKMLFRSLAEIYENLQTFLVAEQDGKTIGCCALEVIWSDLAEIKSLAIDSENRGKGVGTALVTAALEQARYLGVPRVFALTLEPAFFERAGFTVIRKEDLPMKVWSDCAKCPKQNECDEIALVRRLGDDASQGAEIPVQRSLWG